MDNFAYIFGNIFALMLFLIVGFGSLLLIVFLIGRWKLFVKTGQKGWHSIIPFYGDYIFIVKIAKLHWAWYLLILLLNIGAIGTAGSSLLLTIFVWAIAFYNLALLTGKEPTPSLIFGGLFPVIVTMVYGFSKLDYDLSVETKPSGLF